jgi:hypothetical protein
MPLSFLRCVPPINATWLKKYFFHTASATQGKNQTVSIHFHILMEYVIHPTADGKKVLVRLTIPDEPPSKAEMLLMVDMLAKSDTLPCFTCGKLDTCEDDPMVLYRRSEQMRRERPEEALGVMHLTCLKAFIVKHITTVLDDTFDGARRNTVETVLLQAPIMSMFARSCCEDPTCTTGIVHDPDCPCRYCIPRPAGRCCRKCH